MQVIPFAEYSLYQMFLIFCFWSFIGWCIEVVDMTYETGEYQNRGFLNMPICPIYGVGVLMILIFFRPISDTKLLLFVTSTVLCTSFEFFMGWGMEKLFHARWWDYSHMKFNFMGYICLRNSLFFGTGCVVMVHCIEPAVERTINNMPVKLGLGIVILMSVLLVIDTGVSIAAAIKLGKKIRRLDEIGKILLSFSTKTGMTLATGTLKIKDKVYKFRDYTGTVVDKVQDAKDSMVGKVQDVKDNMVGKVQDVKDNVVEKMQDMNAANIEKLQNEFERLINEKDAATDRLLKAFPRMKSGRYSDSLRLLKDKILRRGKDDEAEIVVISIPENEEEQETITENS